MPADHPTDDAETAAIRERAARTDRGRGASFKAYYREDVSTLLAKLDAARAEIKLLRTVYDLTKNKNCCYGEDAEMTDASIIACSAVEEHDRARAALGTGAGASTDHHRELFFAVRAYFGVLHEDDDAAVRERVKRAIAALSPLYIPPEDPKS